jgi:hypothetical protein
MAATVDIWTACTTGRGLRGTTGLSYHEPASEPLNAAATLTPFEPGTEPLMEESMRMAQHIGCKTWRVDAISLFVLSRSCSPRQIVYAHCWCKNAAATLLYNYGGETCMFATEFSG